MKENIEEDIIKKNGNPQNVDLITLLRQFKREGIENFIVLRKNNFDNILSDYKRALKENEELEHKYDKALSDLIHNEKVILWLHKQRDILQDQLEEKGE